MTVFCLPFFVSVSVIPSLLRKHFFCGQKNVVRRGPNIPQSVQLSLFEMVQSVNYMYTVLFTRCFGGEVSWHSGDALGATFDESSEFITHQIVDRPVQGHRYLSR